MRTDSPPDSAATSAHPVPAAATAIFRRRATVEVLLVHLPADDGQPYADTWVLPGGEVAPGETPPEAAVREVRVTTGIVMAVDALEWLWALPAASADGDRYHTHYFAGFTTEVIDLRSSAVSLAECKWLTIEGAYAASVSRVLTIPPTTTEVLRRLLEEEIS